MTQPPPPGDPGDQQPAQGASPQPPQAPQAPPPAPAAPPMPPPPAYPPPAQNPYGGPVLTDPYGHYRGTEPGTVGYVEAHFGPVAGFGDRVLALLLDGLLGLVAFAPMLFSIPFFIAGAPERTGYDAYGYAVYGSGNTTMLVVGILFIVLGFLVALGVQLWNRVFRMGRRGQSIGKGVVGLMLIDARTGQPIGAGMCFVRELVSNVVNQVFYLSALWMLWDDDRQTVADKAAHSTVIKVAKA